MAKVGPSDARGLTPKQLAEQWKRQGGLDALRKQLLQDFLVSPDRDQLLASLDALLPTLLSSSSTLARLPRKDRLAAVLRTLQQRAALREPVGRVEVELRSAQGKGKRVERELKRCLCEVRGVPYVQEEDDGEEELKVEIKREQRVKAEDAAESAALSSPQALAMPTTTSQFSRTTALAPSLATPDPPAQPSDAGMLSPAQWPNPTAPEPIVGPATATYYGPAGVQTAAAASSAADGDVEMADAAAPAQSGSESTPA